MEGAGRYHDIEGPIRKGQSIGKPALERHVTASRELLASNGEHILGVGYAGTKSYNQFYDLPSMVQGDEVILTDANGSTYTYRVTDVFAERPQDTWVTEPQAGRDMVTLQTCVASVDDW